MTTNVMTILVDGAMRAAQLAPLVFTLGAAQPAAAQLPRPVMTALAPAPATAVAPQAPQTPQAPQASQASQASQARTVVLAPGAAMDALQLTISHVDVQVNGGQALVRTTLIYRNDSAVPVDAAYSVPLPALFGAPGEPLVRLGAVANELKSEGDGGCGDEPYEFAQFAEAGEPMQVHYERGTVTVAPGEEVTLVLARPVELIRRGERHRLVLPLDFQRGATFTPRFSAQVEVNADLPVQSLRSATHGGEVSGTGSTNARLVVADGRVYEGQFLAVDFELGQATAQAAATEVEQSSTQAADTPVRNAAAWGGEGRGVLHTSFMALGR
jgi:hypothetical protein